MPALEPAGWLVAYAPYWGLLLGGALLLYSYVEVPFMNLRGAFEKPRKAAVSASRALRHGPPLIATPASSPSPSA